MDLDFVVESEEADDASPVERTGWESIVFVVEDESES